jgi:hypothetical protein
MLLGLGLLLLLLLLLVLLGHQGCGLGLLDRGLVGSHGGWDRVGGIPEA